MSGTAGPPPPGKQDILARHALFSGLDPAIIARLASHAVTQKVKAGTTIFRKGDSGSRLYAVCTGCVRITTPSEDGKDAILNSISRGQIFGEIAALDGGMRTADAVAVEPCEFMVIERRDILDVMREYPAVSLRIIEVLCGRLRHTSEQVEDVVFLGLPARLAKALLQSAVAAAESASPKPSVRMTQQALSQIIGASRESTNKQLRDWQQHGWIKLARGTVAILSPDALKEIASTHGST